MHWTYHLATGLLSHTPLLGMLQKGTRGTNSAAYCHAVWLRHLVVALEAFDHASDARNLRIFDELVELFRRRAPIAGPDAFPRMSPTLDDYGFPAGILDEAHLAGALADDRLARLRAALADLGAPGGTDPASPIRFVVPWYASDVIDPGSVDFLYSQAVLEHVEDVPHTYASMYRWLRPGGFASHQIDFKCHNTAAAWNGHWAVSDRMWHLMKGRKPYLLNRQPCSVHLQTAADAGFEVVAADPIVRRDGLPRARLQPRFRDLTDDDIVTSGVHLLLRRPAAV